MIGKLCKEENQKSKTTYTYNLKGKLASKRTESANNLTTPIFESTIEYSYNDYGQLISLTYPNQNKVIYTYFNDKISSVSYYIHILNETKELVSNIEYSPFSNIEERMTWRTSQGDFNHSKNINKDSLITNIINNQTNGLNLSISYDKRFNITEINNVNDTLLFKQGYDNRSRIISSSVNSISPTSYGYSYNTSSDRIDSIKNTNLSTYNYDNNSHKLLNVSGYDNHQYSYDLNGNTITQNNNTFTYNTSNRLAKVTNSSEDTDYFYNSFGERYLKYKKSLTNNNEDKNWFIYDGSSLLYEKNESNNIASEEINYIYLNNKPIGIIKNNNIYYIQTDHLGTPRVILDSNNNLLWKWDYSEVFGNTQPIENGLNFNLRFPGQYWDSEKSSSYNVSRDYNPLTGRYLQSDPMGLEAGVNTYGYVDANPLSYIDEDGNMPSLPQGLVDFGAGMGDSASLGMTKFVRQLLDIGSVNNCNGFYLAGELTDMGMNIASLGGSIYLKSLIKGMNDTNKKAIRNEGKKQPSYKKLQETGYEVHHTNPLFGHFGIKGRSTKKPSLFPTGGLPPYINSSSLNLTKIPTAEHKGLHKKLAKLENFWEINHSSIINGLKIELLGLNQCNCK